MEWEKEENAKRNKDIAAYCKPEDLTLAEYKSKSTPDKVLEVVKAVEKLAYPTSNTENFIEAPRSPGIPKTTTVVMSKHSLEPQNGSITV